MTIPIKSNVFFGKCECYCQHSPGASPPSLSYRKSTITCGRCFSYLTAVNLPWSGQDWYPIGTLFGGSTFARVAMVLAVTAVFNFPSFHVYTEYSGQKRERVNGSTIGLNDFGSLSPSYL